MVKNEKKLTIIIGYDNMMFLCSDNVMAFIICCKLAHFCFRKKNRGTLCINMLIL